MKYDDTKARARHAAQDHYTVIIVGSGFGGLAVDIRLKTQLGVTDTVVYEKLECPYGTWSPSSNTYPGAACDIPSVLYSYSFAQAPELGSQWASQKQIEKYMDSVIEKFAIDNIVTKHQVAAARFNDDKGIWSVKVRNLDTGEVSNKTCNIFVLATGPLSEPSIPSFPGFESFKGEAWHTARWNHKVDLTGKDVVLIGNGCTAAQIVPEIVDKVRTLAQICRSRQTILPRPKIPDGKFIWILFKYVPGLMRLMRWAIFLFAEMFFRISDIVRGKRLREKTLQGMNKYIDQVAPAKYKEKLQPNFNVGSKRRIFDSGYYAALNRENFTLYMDDGIKAFKERSVVTQSGVEVPCDIAVLATGFKTQDFFFPMEVYNGKNESLIQRFKSTGAKAYLGVFVSDFPNLLMIMGPNTTTGHSSVIYTIECQTEMILQVIKPVIKKLRHLPPAVPAPTVQVKAEIEHAYFRKLRQEMKRKVWEIDRNSWYCDRETGTCTALLPFSQIWYWWATRRPNLRKEFTFERL